MPKNKLLATFFILGVITISGAIFCSSKIINHNNHKEDIKNTALTTPEVYSTINIPTTKDQDNSSVPATKEQITNDVPVTNEQAVNSVSETNEQSTNSAPATKEQPENSGTSVVLNNQGSDLNNKLYKYTSKSSYKSTCNVYSAQMLSICNQVGNITLYEAEINDIRLTTNISVKAKSQEIAKELMDNIMIYKEENNNIFKINVLSKKTKTDYWIWKTNTYPLSYVEIEFDVAVPKKFNSYKVDDSTGNIKLSDFSGTLKVNNLTGDINVINANLVGENTIDVKTGSVNVKTDLSTAKTFAINTMTGSINLVILKDKGISLEASLITGNIGGKYNGGYSADNNSPGTKSVSKVYNGGTTHVKLKTFTGDINVD